MDKSKNPAVGAKEARGRKTSYKDRLFSFVPIYTTRLVREGEVPYDERTGLSSPGDTAAVVMDYFLDKDREEFLVLLLSTSGKLIGIVQASVGGLAASIVEPRQVFKAAILANAASVIVVHNHPSGNPEPSREDIRITRQLVEAGKLMGVPVLDHVIIAEQRFTSLAERGLLA